MRPSLQNRRGSRGVALVVTLLMMSVLTMMVVGMAGVMRNEQAAARNLTYRVLAEQMADLGAREGMATVLSNSLVAGLPGVTGPGWMLVNGTPVRLFSYNSNAAAGNAVPSVDLENLGTNSLILSVGSGQTGRITVHWSNVVAPGVTNGSAIGRFAWWVDDEGTKANLNLVGGEKNSASNMTSLVSIQSNLPLYPLPFFLTNPVTGEGNSATNALRFSLRTNAILSPEMLKSPTNLGGPGFSSEYKSYKGNVTTWSSTHDLTPWGTPRVNLNTATLQEIEQALATNVFGNFFGAGASVAGKYGGGAASQTNTNNGGNLVIRQVAANILGARGTPVLLTNAADYYTAENLSTDSLRARHGIPQTISSMQRTPSLGAVRVRVEYRRTGTSLQTRLGVWVQVLNPYNQVFSNYSLVVRPRKFRFQVVSAAPIARPTVIYGAPLANVPADNFFYELGGMSMWAGPSTVNTPEELYWWPWNQAMSASLPQISAQTDASTLLSTMVTFSFATPPTGCNVARAFVILDQVGLYSSDPPTTQTLVDWLSVDDLNHPDVFGSTSTLDPGQIEISPTTNAVALTNRGTSQFLSGTTPSAWADNSVGVKRIDPQTRFSTLVWDPGNLGQIRSGGWPSTVKAWTTTTSESNNMRTVLFAGLPPDPIPNSSSYDTYEEHPHFVSGYVPTNGFVSVAQLGAIHTGLPWRTLRLGPSSAAELALGPPDWTLLDVFTVTNAPDERSRINLNSVGWDADTATNRPTISVGGSNSVAHRGWAVLGSMVVMTNSLQFFQDFSNGLARMGIPDSFATRASARMTATNPSNNLTDLGLVLGAALANPRSEDRWSANSNAMAGLPAGWGRFRSTNTNSFWPTRGLAFRGEMAELPVLTQADPVEDQQEGRLRFFMDLLTTRSDTFTVWSAGQGLQVNTNLNPPRTNVMGEVRRQTVFQRVPMYQTNVVGNVTNLTLTNWQLKVLYSRDHVVE